MKTIWQKFWMTILGGILVVVFSAAISGYMATKAVKANKIQNAAPKSYVDDKTQEVKEHCDEEDEKLRQEIKDKASKESVEQILVDVKYNREQNDKIYDYLLNNR